MFHKNLMAAVVCLTMVGVTWAQENTAQIKPIQIVPASVIKNKPAGMSATLSDDCCAQGNFFGRARPRMQMMGRPCNACGTDCGGNCRAAAPAANGCGSGCGTPCRYFSGFGGWVGLQDLSTQNGAGAPINGTFREGWAVGGSIGRYLNQCTRVEMESAYRNNSGDTFTLAAAPGVLDGHFNNYAGMFNIFRDFNNGCGKVNPYAGVGIGYGYTHANVTAGGTAYEIRDGAFAYQGIFGLSYRTDKCNDVFVEYRYYGNTQVDMVPTAGGASIDFNYLSHNVVFGVRLNR